MYSRFPMPHIEWDKESMRYALCFFPLVGAAIGVSMWLIGNFIFGKTEILFFSSVMTLLPLLLTGGIHFDGFLDTVDAMCSYADKEKRSQILKDPHTGAFGVMWGVMYFVAYLGLWSEVKVDMFPVISVSYCISRTLSALSVVCFKISDKSKTASAFANGSDKKTVIAITAVFLAAEFIGICFYDIKYALAVSAAALVCFLWHYRNCTKVFEGINGDLAGFFLQICEICTFAAVIFSGRIL